LEIYRADNWKAEVEAAGGKDINLARHALTDNDVYDAEDAFSPDGKWICFCSMRTGDGDIYVMKSDGTHVVRITNAPGYDGGPFFSPDGKHLCYRSDRHKNSLLQLYVADLAFDNDGNITGISAEHQLTDNANVNWCPFWYPDGQHLIYSTNRHGPANFDLYAIRADGTHDTPITYGPGANVLPVFSPDGKWLMWACRRSTDNTPQVIVARFHPPEGW
jgi:TolB protein